MKIKRDGNLVYINDVLVYTHSNVSWTTAYPMYLFAINQADTVIYTSKNPMNVYSFRITQKSSGSLIQYLIPVLKDGVYCMYDNVSGTYYYNQGTGSFTGG